MACEDSVGIEFNSHEDFEVAAGLLFSLQLHFTYLVEENVLLMSVEMAERLEVALKAHGIAIKRLGVVTFSELSPEEQSDVRRQRAQRVPLLIP